MGRAKLIFIGLLAALLVPIGVFLTRGGDTSEGSLLLYCAAGMRKPVEKAAARYKEETGVAIEIQFAGSGTLLGSIEASGKGDLYLAADASYVEIAREKNLAREAIPLADLTAGLIVAKGNPLGLRTLADLRDKNDLRIVLANPEAASVGKFTKKVLVAAGLWDSVSAKALAMKPTVNELTNDVKLGAADVAIAWDAVATQYPELEFINVEEFDSRKKRTNICVLESAADPTATLRFARFLAARDRGQKFFEEDGFAVIDGDKWEPRPELVFFSGAMLQPAIRDRMEYFKKREGIDLKFVPNGCGILVSQMRAGARPDAYFSCDTSFMVQVQDLFDTPRRVSGNDIVIVVANDARGKISRPSDLTKADVRLGLAHPENSALGALTVKLLAAMALDTTSSKQLDSATGDFLVNQLRAGSLDAIIVYRSNAMAHPETLKDAHIVEIDHPLAIAHQPFAVGRNSDHKNLMMRLFDTLTASDGKAAFLKYGFHWEMPE